MLETEAQVPAFCLKWKTGRSFQERSPSGGGHAWLCRLGTERTEREGGEETLSGGASLRRRQTGQAQAP